MYFWCMHRSCHDCVVMDMNISRPEISSISIPLDAFLKTVQASGRRAYSIFKEGFPNNVANGAVITICAIGRYQNIKGLDLAGIEIEDLIVLRMSGHNKPTSDRTANRVFECGVLSVRVAINFFKTVTT